MKRSEILANKFTKKQSPPLQNEDTLTHSLLEKIRNTPFWCGNNTHISNKQKDNVPCRNPCCFNHIIGLPMKRGIEMPLFDYEIDIFNALQKNKMLKIVKATGLGITEFFLRWAEWMCLRNDDLKGSQVVILVGPSQRKAEELIRRMKTHLKLYEVGTKYRFDLNGVEIEAYPTMNINTVRSLTSPKIMLVDEAAFFGLLHDEEARAVTERYIGKSDPWIIYFSTPNVPDGMFYDLMKEDNEYYKIELPYTVGLDKIYTMEEIEKAKLSPSFEREYNLQWGYGVGDVFELEKLDPNNENSVVKYYNFTFDEQSKYDSILALDPAYSDSKFGIVGMIKKSDKAYVVIAEELTKASDSEALRKINTLLDLHHFSNLYIDGQYANLITEFKNRIPTHGVNFRTEGVKMIDNSSNGISNDEYRIHPKYKELLKQLRTAKRKDDGMLDKRQASLDMVDAFNMAAWYMKRGGGYSIKV